MAMISALHDLPPPIAALLGTAIGAALLAIALVFTLVVHAWWRSQ